MVVTYVKGQKVPLGPHFTTADFDCHCKRPGCLVTLVDELLVESLGVLWGIVGAFAIDSGFRCHAHNAEVGGAEDSQHLLGKAADCRSLRGLNGNLMARSAEKIIPFFGGGIGIYKAFAHLDVRGHKARWALGKPC